MVVSRSHGVPHYDGAMETTTPMRCVMTPTEVLDERGAAIADVSAGVLSEDLALDAPSGTLIVRCGHHARRDPEPSAEALRGWSQGAWDSYFAMSRAVLGRARDEGIEVVVWAGLGGRLTDAICTQSWVRAMGDLGARVLADPVGWIAPSMEGDAEDHLRRFVDAYQEMACVWGVVDRSDELGGSDSIGALIRAIPTPRILTLGA